MLPVLPGSAAIAQSGRFDLEKTKTVLTGLIQQTLADRGIPSMSIALVRGDSIVWKAAFGYSNMRTRTPATTETLYSTGSSGKSVTAAAIMQLVEQGKIKLDDPINRYLGDSRVQDQLQVEKPVTFRHILSHWSGLRAGAETQPIWSRKLPKSLEAMTSALYSVRAPETKWEYNNFAYGAAGLLVQKISDVRVREVPGRTHSQAARHDHGSIRSIRRRRWSSGWRFRTMRVVRWASPGRWPRCTSTSIRPATCIMTAEDMARFLGAQLNGGIFQGKRILSEESVLAMHKPYFGGTYGFGFWMIRDSVSGDTLVHHGGAIAGQRAFMIGDIDAKVGVYYMTNSDYLPDSPPMRSEIVDAALKLLRGEELRAPASDARESRWTRRC